MLTVAMIASVATSVPVPRFEDVTTQSGIAVVSGSPRARTAGSPVAWIDWDSDGWPDLVVGDASGTTRLYRNNAGQLPFVESTPPELAAIRNAVSIEHLVVAPGALSNDVDAPVPGLLFSIARGTNEGLVVLALTSSGPRRIPVGRPAPYIALTTHGDLDGDGAQDIIAASAVCGAGAAPATSIFRLERFPAGYRLSTEDPIGGGGCFPVPLVTDYYGTGHPALMVATDFGLLDAPSYVYNDGFYETLPGVYGMGIAPTDLNDDGQIDYVVTSAGPDLLWTSSPEGHKPSVVGRNTEWGETAFRFKWGVVYNDFDNDGTQDLWMAVGGGPQEGLIPSDPQGRDVFLSHGEDVANEVGVGLVGGQRAIAVTDYDRDGLLDALEVGAFSSTLYHNVSTDAGHWLELRVPDAPGARVQVTACNRTITRELGGTASAVASELLLHAGLGACAEPATVTVRWPWLREQTYGPFEVDTVARIPDPGTMWVTPSLVDRAMPITVHSTLAGSVTVNGVALVDGVATLTSESDAGTFRLAVTVDGEPISLAPKYTVAMNTVDIVASPWPLRIGVSSTVLAVTPPGAKLAVVAGAILSRHSVKDDGNGGASAGSDGTNESDATESKTLTASAKEVALTVGGKPLGVRAVTNITAKPFVDLDVSATSVHVRAAFLDELGAASVVPAQSVKAGWDGQEPVTLGSDLPPWLDADLPRAAGPLHLFADASQILAIDDAIEPPGPVDPTRTRIWVTTPLVRADGQDVVEVAVYMRDTAGRLMEPDASWLPTAEGCTPIDTAFNHSSRHFGSASWVAHLRIGTTVGPVRIHVGPLETLVWAMEPDPAVVDVTTTLTRTDHGFELIPRDRFGQRVGSGLTTDPPFTYDGVGQFSRVGPETNLSVVVAGLVVARFADGEASTQPYVADESEGCGVGRSSTRSAVPWLVLLGASLAVLRRRTRLARRA